MAYLSQDDYTLRISVTDLTEVLTEASTNSGLSAAQVRANAENWASATIKSYVSGKYAIAGELAKNSPDTSRNFQIMAIMIDLSLFTLHKTISPRDIPEIRQVAYGDSIKLLEQMRDGHIILDVPQPDTSVGGAFAESQPKFISKPYQDLSIDPSGNNNNPLPEFYLP